MKCKYKEKIQMSHSQERNKVIQCQYDKELENYLIK
jgi:hypothetical protein